MFPFLSSTMTVERSVNSCEVGVRVYLLLWNAPGQSAVRQWRRVSLLVCEQFRGNPHDRCLYGSDNQGQYINTSLIASPKFCLKTCNWNFHDFLDVFKRRAWSGKWILKGYGKGRKLRPRIWWCLLAAVLFLRRTGWSSEKSAGTERRRSKDCALWDPEENR